MADDIGHDGNGVASPVIIKKYANRRLYNTRSSSYVTLDHLARMVKDGVALTVHDAKTGDDLTRSVLIQIIVEEEAKGQNLLPVSFLRQLISFYGDSLQGLVPQYLEITMRSFANNQEQIRDYLNDAFGGLFPFDQIEEMSRRNMDMFAQAVNMFSGDSDPSSPAAAPDDGGAGEGSLDELRAQLHAMQRQIDDMSDKSRE